MKISELLELQGSEALTGTLQENVFFPVVAVSSSGNVINRKINMKTYWNAYLKDLVDALCEAHKSTYNFGGDGGDSPGGQQGGSSEVTAQEFSELRDQVLTLSGQVSAFNSQLSDKASVSQLNGVSSRMDSYDTSLGNLNTAYQALGDSTNENSLISKFTTLKSNIDSNGTFYITLLSGSTTTYYQYSPTNGISTLQTLPQGSATKNITIRSIEADTAMYKLDYNYNIQGGENPTTNEYVVTIGNVNVSSLNNATINYTKGTINFKIRIEIGENNVEQTIPPQNGSTTDYTGIYVPEVRFSPSVLEGVSQIRIKLIAGNVVYPIDYNIGTGATVTGSYSTVITASGLS